VKILVTGASGMLGSRFLAAPGGHVTEGIGHAALDVETPGALRAVIAAHAPDAVVNCAADTDVEGGENRPEAVHAANALLPARLAAACRDVGAVFVQISSTGCYGAWKQDAYVEGDPLRPATVHHKAKAEGELAVQSHGGDWLIVRTGWLYGAPPGSPKNFVGRRLEEAAISPVMLGDDGQWGNPTFAGDVVRQVQTLLAAGERGIFNCVAQGAATRLDYVRAIVAAAGLPCEVRAAPPGHFKRRAPVSPNETARNARLQMRGLDTMPDWRLALQDYVRGLNA
jgi:dTDP-4-dehydrorhamnose reductase